MKTLRVLAAIFCFACALSSRSVSAQGDFVHTNPSVVEWIGELPDDPKLEVNRSYHMVFEDQETFAKSWSQWFPQSTVPKINFESHLVVASKVRGQKITQMRVGDHGATGIYVYIRLEFEEEQFGGVSWGVSVIPRGNIKKVGDYDIKPKTVSKEPTE